MPADAVSPRSHIIGRSSDSVEPDAVETSPLPSSHLSRVREPSAKPPCSPPVEKCPKAASGTDLNPELEILS